MTHVHADDRCLACVAVDDVVVEVLDALPWARGVLQRDPQTVFYLEVLREVAHDHRVHVNRAALHRRLVEGFERHQAAERAAHHLAAQPLDPQLVAELQAARGETPR